MFAPQADVIDRTAELLKDGNVHELAGTFSSTIEMTIMEDENVYSSSQAEQLLANFLKRCQPRSAKVLHRITSNANYRYAVIILNTNSGTYRTAVALKNVNGKFELNELRIEVEKTK
jgi:F420-0:gamma-glutamyl ligase